jgi:IS605 OrfB family transposase
MENDTSFDGWVTLTSLGNKIKINIPFKKHKHFNKLLQKGKIKSGIRISKTMITFMFDIEVKPRTKGSTIGIDVGLKSTLSSSNGQVIQKDTHGHDYMSICKKLSLKRKGSKGFRKASSHRTNYINWTVNQLNLNDVKEVNREEIKNLRKGKRQSGLMSRWNYGELFDVLDKKLEDRGVRVNKLNPTYTSQRCSQCGWVRKGNRKLKLFMCDKCCYQQDSDLNASINLSLKLKPIGVQQRLKQENKTGFYWNVEDQVLIVPECPTKTNNLTL